MELLVHHGDHLLGDLLEVPVHADLGPNRCHLPVRVFQEKIPVVPVGHYDKTLAGNSLLKLALLDRHESAPGSETFEPPGSLCQVKVFLQALFDLF